MMTAPRIRTMTQADLVAGQALSAAFGWPHRLEDWELMLQLGEGVVAERDCVVCGTAMAWRYGADAATVGMIIVAESLQGQGIGRRMLETLLDNLEGRTVCLHATPEGLKLYRALDFVEESSVQRHQAEVLGPVATLPGVVRTVSSTNLRWVEELDQAACGIDRSQLLRALLEAGDGVLLHRNERPVAIALQRRFGRGHVIGPVLAPDSEAACVLVAHCLAALTGRFVRIDTGEDQAFGAWLARQGLPPSERVIGMTRGSRIRPMGHTQKFALASQAYG